MKLLGVRRNGIYLYLDTTEGERKNCFRYGTEELERKARSLIGKNIEYKTWQPERYPPEDWFSEIWEAPNQDSKTPTDQPEPAGYKKDFQYNLKFKNPTRQRLIGPPGTGKTHTLIEWVKNELKDKVDSRQIAFISFTNVAANTAKERVSADPDIPDHLNFPNFSTLHSLATRMGGSLGLHLVKEEHLKKFDPRVYIEKEWTIHGDSGSIVERHKHPVLQAYSYQLATKSQELEFDVESIEGVIDALNSYFVNVVNKSNVMGYAEAYINAYEKFKQHEGLADFNDVILNVLNPNFDQSRVPCFEVLFVDEAQDLSKLQWDFIELLSAKARRTVVAGDDDQAIMASFGASPESFVKFEVSIDDHPLDKSYRIPPSIKQWLDLKIIPLVERNPIRILKKWFGNLDKKGQGSITDYQLKKHIDKNGQEVTTKGLIEFKDFINLMSKRASEEWLIMAPTKATVEKIHNALEDRNIPHYNQRRYYGSDVPTIYVQTIHTSKGMDVKNAALVVDRLADNMMLLEDSRLLYVALTRAESELFPLIVGRQVNSSLKELLTQ